MKKDLIYIVIVLVVILVIRMFLMERTPPQPFGSGCSTPQAGVEYTADAVSACNNLVSEGGLRFRVPGYNFNNFATNHTLTVTGGDQTMLDFIQQAGASTTNAGTRSYGRFYNTDYCNTYVAIAADTPGQAGAAPGMCFIRTGTVKFILS